MPAASHQRQYSSGRFKWGWWGSCPPPFAHIFFKKPLFSAHISLYALALNEDEADKLSSNPHFQNFRIRHCSTVLNIRHYCAFTSFHRFIFRFLSMVIILLLIPYILNFLSFFFRPTHFTYQYPVPSSMLVGGVTKILAEWRTGFNLTKGILQQKNYDTIAHTKQCD